MKKSLSVVGIAYAIVFAGCVSAPGVRTEAPEALRVAVYCDDGPGGIGAVEWLRLVDLSPEMELQLVDGRAVRAGALARADILVMPGGASTDEGRTLGDEGIAKMKDFLRAGGGYLGTCAGCCLLMDEPLSKYKKPRPRARLIPWESTGSVHGPLFLDYAFNAKGRAALGLAGTNYVMRYSGGPCLRPTTNVIEGAVFEEWATFDCEASPNGRMKPELKMFGAAAVVAGTYGKGRVFATSAHPEYFEGSIEIIRAAFRWVSGREVTFPRRNRAAGTPVVGLYCDRLGSVAKSETVLALLRSPELDVVELNADSVWQNALEHVDVLVFAGQSPKKLGKAEPLIENYRARGGRVLELGCASDPVAAVLDAVASAELPQPRARARRPKISVFAKFVRKISKERGISLAQAADMLYALGIRGYDCGPDEEDLDELAATKLKPVNFYYSPDWLGHAGDDRYWTDAAKPAECLEKARKYGIPRIMVVPPDFTDGRENPAEFEKILAAMKDFVAEAKKLGIAVTVEDYGGCGNACSYAKYLKRFLEEIPDLRFALDSGNLYYAGRGEDVLEMMKFAKGRIGHVHLKDQSEADNRGYVTLGLGAVPNEKIVKATRKAGYDGWYTLENPVGDTYLDTVRQVSVIKAWFADCK